jgi:hypothetical protein
MSVADEDQPVAVGGRGDRVQQRARGVFDCVQQLVEARRLRLQPLHVRLRVVAG